jgi:hypothetical protein
MRAPVCITGMHRSGTSLMAMLLHACGLRLGPRRDLLTANVDNEAGFFEDFRFVRLNDAILRHAGGSWEKPPPCVPPPGSRPSERWLEFRARWALRRTASAEPWGWKDPRTALTLPFWTSIAPELKLVVCLRHPATVAWSLRRRTHCRSNDGETLWRLYNERLLAAVPAERRIIVLNDAVLADPAAALAPVLKFIGLPPERSASDKVAALVRPELQRARQEGPGECSPEAEALYRRMVAESEMCILEGPGDVAPQQA